MTAPTVAAVASETQNSGTDTRVIPAPTNIAVGDLLVAIFLGHNTFTISARPSGWANWILQDESTDETLCVEWKIAAAGDVGASSYTWTTSAAAAGPEIMLRITGHNSSPLNVKNSGTSGNGTSHTTPSITTTVADCLVLSIFGMDESSANSWSGGGTNEHADLADTGYYESGAVYSSTQASPGSVSKTGTSSLTDPAVTAIIAIKPSGLGATVNQTSETDTAQAIAKQKARSVGQNTETNTAQAVTRVKRAAVGQNTETDTAQAVTRVKRVTVGQISETDLAQPITRLVSAIQVPVNQVAETDEAQGVTRAKRMMIGQAAETDMAQAITRRKIKTVAQVAETDEAQGILTGDRILVGQAAETDTAQAITRRKIKAVAQVMETDEAFGITSVTGVLLQQVQETDLAQAIFPLKRVVVAQPIEVDFAQPITAIKLRMIGQVNESDAAQVIMVVTGFVERFGRASIEFSIENTAILSSAAIDSAMFASAVRETAEMEILPR